MAVQLRHTLRVLRYRGYIMKPPVSTLQPTGLLPIGPAANRQLVKQNGQLAELSCINIKRVAEKLIRTHAKLFGPTGYECKHVNSMVMRQQEHYNS